MEKQKLLKKILFLILFIFFINLIAHKFYWYVSLWYFDMIMHTLGGFWLALSVIFLLKIKIFSWKNFLKVILGVIAVGIAWEIFEFGVDEVILKNPLNTKSDTFSDILCDSFGGIVGFLYYFKNSLKDIIKI